MSEAKNAKSGGERMRKYREENKLRNELSNVKQQVRRSLILASGTPSYPHISCHPPFISSCHHITISPRTKKSHGGHFHRKILKTSLCDMVVQWSKTKYFMNLNP